MKPNKQLPLFAITGASCVGKSTMSEILFSKEENYIVLESDLLWHDVYNTPNDNYKTYRELWLKMSYNISQIGLPVVLCGCATPEQFENCYSRKHFTSIHYLAVVCDEDVLKERMCIGRSVTDENWIKSSIGFNRWLKENAGKTIPKIELIDNSNLTPAESAKIADRWINSLLNEIKV